MKKCPFCAEEIQDQAIKCRYCFEMLPVEDQPTGLQAEAEQSKISAEPTQQAPQASSGGANRLDLQLIQEWLAHANRLASFGRWNEAKEAFLKVVDADPQNTEIRDPIIQHSIQKGDYSEVLRQQMDCAEIYLIRGERDKAVERYEAILHLEGTVQPGTPAAKQLSGLVDYVRPEIYFQIGDFHRECGRVDLALQNLQHSRDLAPDRWDTHLALGRAYVLKESISEAVSEFREVIRLAPEKSGPVHAMLGEVLLQNPGNVEVIGLQKATDPSSQETGGPPSTRASAWSPSASPSAQIPIEARTRLETAQAYERTPGQGLLAARFYFEAAEMCRTGGMIAQARELYQKVLQLDPGNVQTTTLLQATAPPLPTSINKGNVESDVKSRLEVAQLYEKMPGQAIKAAQYYFAAAEVCRTSGMLAEACHIYQKVLQLDPGNVQSTTLLQVTAPLVGNNFALEHDVGSKWEAAVSQDRSQARQPTVYSIPAPSASRMGVQGDTRRRQSGAPRYFAILVIGLAFILWLVHGPSSSPPAQDKPLPNPTINGVELTPKPGHVVTKEDLKNAKLVEANIIIERELKAGKTPKEIMRDHPDIYKLSQELDGVELTPKPGHVVTAEDLKNAKIIEATKLIEAERRAGKSDEQILRDHPDIYKLSQEL